MKKVKINDINCYAPNSRDELINFAILKKSILVAVNAEKILKANNETLNIINRNIGYPDGIGAVWALRKKRCNNVVKIPGCELWLDFINEFEKTKSFYLIGSSDEVIIETVKKLKIEFPSINVVNFRNGYINSPEEKEKLIQDIIRLKPDFVFVAMGSPKQEILMEQIQSSHEAVYLGLGGSFDVYTNKVKRAPQWWINNNLEWAYRLLKQPSRLKRQFPLIKFLWNLILNKY
ncbi:MAG: WecB/TagA/CpsF family glycosyltransferase [Crocinitomicaceae bacterium]